MPKTLKESMQAMRDICKANSKCNACPLNSDKDICFAGIAPAFWDDTMIGRVVKAVEDYEEHKLVLELLEQEPKTGHCKDCKYFEYDSVAKVDGIPLIVAHEICNKWGDGCKTREDGYCFLFEPQESEDKE